MTTTIETERLLIRPALITDTDGFFALDSDPEVLRYVGQQPMQQREEATKVIAYLQHQYTTNGIGRWVVIEKESKTFLGWAGLKLIREAVNGHQDFYELGYRLLHRHWGKGFATEAAKATLAYGFRELKPESVFAMADVRNIASDAVLRKCGMIPGNTFKHEGLLHNWYSINRHDWLV